MVPDKKKEQWLVVFPWAGGSAVSFIDWHRNFSRLLLTEYIGHGTRMWELLPDTMTELLSDVQYQIEKNIPEGSELILFGHSMGGMAAAEVAIKVEQEKKYVLRTVCLSSVIFPYTEAKNSAFSESVMHGKNLSTSLYHNNSVKPGKKSSDQLESILKQDLALMSRHTWNISFNTVNTLSAPIHYFYGEQDLPGIRQNLERWKSRIPFQRIHAFPGGHFYLEEPGNRAKIIRIIKSML